MQKLILATGSARRHHLFRGLGLSFNIDRPTVEESYPEHYSPDEVAVYLARIKGDEIAARHPHALVVSADTLVVLDGQILGKPKDAAEAKEMLGLLSGRTHSVYTGVQCVLTDADAGVKESFQFYEKTNVTFASLSEQEIDHYVAGGSPLDKAGAYGIQDDGGSLFVQKIEGDYYTVVGFPLHAFYQQLKNRMPECWNRLFL
ncbi:MAG: Maf family protein [Balneolaceae bacterium]